MKKQQRNSPHRCARELIFLLLLPLLPAVAVAAVVPCSLLSVASDYSPLLSVPVALVSPLSRSCILPLRIHRGTGARARVSDGCPGKSSSETKGLNDGEGNDKPDSPNSHQPLQERERKGQQRLNEMERQKGEHQHSTRSQAGDEADLRETAAAAAAETVVAAAEESERGERACSRREVNPQQRQNEANLCTRRERERERAGGE